MPRSPVRFGRMPFWRRLKPAAPNVWENWTNYSDWLEWEEPQNVIAGELNYCEELRAPAGGSRGDQCLKLVSVARRRRLCARGSEPTLQSGSRDPRLTPRAPKRVGGFQGQGRGTWPQGQSVNDRTPFAYDAC
jgi:hypothetical protein